MENNNQSVPLKLSDEWPTKVARVVGRISIAFAQLQHVVYVAAKRGENVGLLEWEQRHRSDNFTKWCRHLVTKSPNDKYLRSLIERAQCAGEGRNDLIHARWGRDKRGKLGRWRRHRDLGIELEPLKDLLSTIRELRDDINRYTKGEGRGKRKAPPEQV